MPRRLELPPRAGSAWRPRPWMAIALIGVATTAALSQSIRIERDRVIDAQLSAEIDERSIRIEEDLEHLHSVLEDVQSLFRVDPDLSPEGFARFVSPILLREPAILALSWNPRVPHARRAAFEAARSDALGRPFRIQEIGPDRAVVLAGRRAEYIPVSYVEPIAQNERALGLDIAAEAQRRAAVDRARDQRELTATAPIRLVQLPDDPLGFLVLAPRYDENGRVGTSAERRGSFLGVTVAVLRVEELIDRAIGRLHDPIFDIEVVDDTEETEIFLHRHLADPTGPFTAEGRTPVEEEIEFAGRTWRLRYFPTDEYLARLRGDPIPWNWITGLALTALLAGIGGTMTERSRRRTTIRALREDEERFRLTVGAIADGWWDWDLRSGALTLSESWFAALGIEDTERESRPETIAALLHPDDREARQEALEGYLDGSLPEFALELRMSHADGSHHWFLERGGVVARDRGGAPTRMVGAIADITRRKIAEEERSEIEERMREAQRLESLGLISGGVAHDFNNWLTTIRNNISIARANGAAEDEIHRALSEIHDATERAADLTSQMLDYAGKGPPRTERIELGRIVDEMRELIRSVVPKGIKIQHDRSPTPATIEADPVQIGQVVMNLITNASDALAGDGRVSIRTGRVEIEAPRPTDSSSGRLLAPGEYSLLMVSDRGCGMNREVRARIFEPFFTTKQTGRGLGLAGVQGILRRHGGAVEVDSRPGHGTTISVLLPYAGPLPVEVESDGSAAGEVRPVRPGPISRRVIVIDDEERVRESLVRLLRRAGHTVEAAETGREGVEMVRAAPEAFELAVIDMTMPGIDGVTTFERLREIHPELEGVIISGYAEAEIGALPEGLLGFLQKPFQTEDLLALVAGEESEA